MTDAAATAARPHAPPAEPGGRRPTRRPIPPSGPIPLSQRLGFRLSALLALALLPLGAISFLQAGAWQGAARDQQAAVLMGETLRVSAPVTGLIREAQGTAEGLALTVEPLIGNDTACDALMSSVKNRSHGAYSIVGFVPVSGNMTCASDGASFDYADSTLFKQIMADLRPSVHVQGRGPVSGTSVILLVEPVLPRAADEPPLGYIALAIPHQILPLLPAATGAGPTERTGPDFLTFNDDGVVLSSTRGSAFAPEDLPEGVGLAELARDGHQTSFTATTASGDERFYAMVPVVDGQLFVLGSIGAHRGLGLGPTSALTPFLSTALMWVASLVVAWLAAEWLVTRYIRRLGRAIRSFASGSRMVGDLQMEGAPAEIREVGQAFLRMTDTILHDEADLEDTVHQREVLLREVHHRVKNNLQLIASIMNMQARRAKSPETKALMRGLQERVMSLATVHKELYQTTGLADVRADELLGDLVRQIVGMASGPGCTFRIETDFAPVHLIPDQAVPLALLLTEGLTNAIKYAEPRPGEPSPRIEIRFAAEPEGRALLLVRNSAPRGEVEPSPEGTGLGRQLVAAFATQLGGDVQGAARDGYFDLTLEFALRPLQGAEQRHSG